jgi:prepilin-type N-terminal cleavage/methylation domain-containing protein
MFSMKNRKNRKARKGFSLVELVVVIIIIAILAVAVFAGGSAVIKKSQVSRVVSDLHNFSIAIEAAVNETPSVANMKANTVSGDTNDMQAILKAINNNLATDYKLEDTATAKVEEGNLKIAETITSGDTKTSYAIFKSAKTDAWGNNYYVILDYGERHCAGQSDFYVTVVSAGPNAQTYVGSNIESDDIFLLVQYSDGDVSAVTYNVASDKMNTTTIASEDATTYTLNKENNKDDNTTKKGVTPSSNALLYAGGKDNKTYTGGVLPVNF